ncbi:MAG: response regulator [Agriterribacter sp.]
MEEKHIVVVDDDSAIQDAVRMIFEHSGYVVTSFLRAEPLLGKTSEIPDLFILDKQLPGIDGLDLCSFLKAQETTKHIPVLILSASPEVRLLAKAACANEFLEKPFKMKALREAVERLLK